MERKKGNIVAALRNDFIAGIAVLLPLVGTIVIVKFLVLQINDVLLEPVLILIDPIIPAMDRKILAMIVKLVILTLILLGIVLTGVLVKNFVIRQIIQFGESLLLKVPFISNIYGLIQQVCKTIFGQKKTFFKKVVLIEYPRKGTYQIGFVIAPTGGVVGRHLPADFISVFVPTPPNPVSGFLIMVHRSEIIDLPITAEEGIKAIVSGGVIMPEQPSVRNEET